MSPVRVDLTMRLADELGVLDGDRLRAGPGARWPPTTCSPPCTTPELIEAVQRAGRRPGAATSARRPRHRRQPGLPGHARGGRARRRRQPRGVPPGVERRSRCTAPTSPAACTTRCRTGPAASASTTTSRSASSGCSTRAPSGWPTSTSTSTTATASSRSSGTTRGCSRSPCTRPARCSSPAPASPTTSAARTREGTRGQRGAAARHRATPAGCAPSTPSCPPLLREFAPDVLVTQHGCDSHIDDPLAHLMLTVDGQRAAYLALHDLAHEVAGGRWVATGGGGYALVDVVPRAWTHLLADRRRARRSTRRPTTPGGLARARPRAARAHAPRSG